MEGLVNRDKKSMGKRLQQLEAENELLIEELEKLGGNIDEFTTNNNKDQAKKTKKNSTGGNEHSFLFSSSSSLYGVVSLSLSLLFTVSLSMFSGDPCWFFHFFSGNPFLF